MHVLCCSLCASALTLCGHVAVCVCIVLLVLLLVLLVPLVLLLLVLVLLPLICCRSCLLLLVVGARPAS